MKLGEGDLIFFTIAIRNDLAISYLRRGTMWTMSAVAANMVDTNSQLSTPTSTHTSAPASNALACTDKTVILNEVLS